MERYADVLKTLERGGAAFDSLPSVFLMRAQAHWLLKDRERAFATLADGSTRFPANTQFLRREVFFLMELGLYQEAAARGQRYLAIARARKRTMWRSAMRSSARASSTRRSCFWNRRG